MKDLFNDNMQIKKISAADQVCDKIKEYIRSGQWQIGERLPSESDLASMFGVNRLTVRMALQKLNTLGILETRTGSGTYVVQFDLDDYIMEASDFYMEPELLENVCEFRKVIEIECLRLASERALPEEYDELEEVLNNYDKIAGLMEHGHRNYKALAQADVEFHKQICKMSHNKLYLYAFIVAQPSIYQYVLILARQRGNLWESNSPGVSPSLKDTPRKIFQTLKDKDIETCKKYYLDMVDHNIEW